MPGLRATTLIVCLGVLLLVGIEVGLRLLTDRSSRWNIRLGAHKQHDPVVYVRNRPHYVFSDGTTLNELGYRAPVNLAHENPADKLRIIYLGDSNTVTPLSEPYPVQVEKLLESELATDVETVNTAVPGYSSLNARLLFETELSEFKADYLFVYLGWNDLGQYGPEGLPYKRHQAGYELSALQRALTNIYSLRFLFAAQRVLQRQQPAVSEPLGPEDRALYDSYRPDHFYENLRAILQLAKVTYPHVYVMSLATLTNDDPTPSELATAHFPTGMDKNMTKLHQLVSTYNTAVRTVAAEEAVPLLELDELFEGPKMRAHFTDSCHFDAEGAGAIARLVADAVLAKERASAR